MSTNTQLNAAKRAKNDEFYTQYADIERELGAYITHNPDVFRDKTILLPCDDPAKSNFTKYFIANIDQLGIKKLISTSYTPGGNGNYLILSQNQSGNTQHLGILNGDGDFQSSEVTALRDEADFIITNPPFSLFRSFISWILEGQHKQFLILGNINAITYKEVFPHILDNTLWIGHNTPGSMRFIVPTSNDEPKYVDVKARWFTNIDHGKRHRELALAPMEYHLTSNAKLLKRLHVLGVTQYPKYDNYDAIEVPYLDVIPSDYTGPMGVPITYLDKHNPDQFELLGCTESEGKGFSNGLWQEDHTYKQPVVLNGEQSIRIYKRIFIKHKRPWIATKPLM